MGHSICVAGAGLGYCFEATIRRDKTGLNWPATRRRWHAWPLTLDTFPSRTSSTSDIDFVEQQSARPVWYFVLFVFLNFAYRPTESVQWKRVKREKNEQANLWSNEDGITMPGSEYLSKNLIGIKWHSLVAIRFRLGHRLTALGQALPCL